MGCLIALSACAQVQAPTGGPKDLDPPKLVEVFPKQGATNYRGTLIRLEFDEYINERNLRQALIVSPGNAVPTYTYRVRKRTLTLEFDSLLAENTTYVLNFSNAIRDATENNEANVQLAFSTGEVLDSLTLSGQVVEGLRGEPIREAAVLLYEPSDTLGITGGKPYYFARTDEEGRFTLTNLKPGRFDLYALQEKDKNLRFNDEEAEKVYFSDTLFQITGKQEGLILPVFSHALRPLRLLSSNPRQQYFQVRYSKPPTGVTVAFLPDTAASFIRFVQEQETLWFHNLRDTPTDSIPTVIQATDNQGNVIRDTVKLKFDEYNPRRRLLRDFTAEILPPQPARTLPPNSPFRFQFTFSKPVQTFTADSVTRFTEADTLLVPADWFALDSSLTSLQLAREDTLRERSLYYFPAGAFTSVEGDTLPEQGIAFTAADAERTGILYGPVKAPFEQYSLEVLNQGRQRVEDSLYSPVGEYRFSFLKPGTKYLRLRVDANGNGRWDNGSFLDSIPPEPVYFWPTPIDVKGNWEINTALLFGPTPAQVVIKPEKKDDRRRRGSR